MIALHGTRSINHEFYFSTLYTSQILLDDVDIRNLNVAWLRRQLGVVSQEPNLFAGTVTENILMGKPEAEFKEVEESAREADAHNFIATLPEVIPYYRIVCNVGSSALILFYFTSTFFLLLLTHTKY